MTPSRPRRRSNASVPATSRASQRSRGGGNTVVGRFVADAARIARAHRATVTAIASAAGATSLPSAGATSPSLDVTLGGRFADVLAAIRALSDGDVPANVRIETIATAAAQTATVTAALRVVLDPPADGEATGARAR